MDEHCVLFSPFECFDFLFSFIFSSNHKRERFRKTNIFIFNAAVVDDVVDDDDKSRLMVI